MLSPEKPTPDNVPRFFLNWFCAATPEERKDVLEDLLLVLEEDEYRMICDFDYYLYVGD